MLVQQIEDKMCFSNQEESLLFQKAKYSVCLSKDITIFSHYCIHSHCIVQPTYQIRFLSNINLDLQSIVPS